MKNYDQALEYEIFIKQEYWFAQQCIQTAKIIFDIGGHIGLFSKWCLSLNSELQIHVFEAFPQLRERCRENLQSCFTSQEEFANQITIHPFWVAKTPGEYTFLRNSTKTMQSSQFSSFLNPQWIPQKVRCENIANIVRHFAGEIDVMKLDIEGMEFEVLLDFTDAERKKVKNLICEVHLFWLEQEDDFDRLKTKIGLVYKSVEVMPSPYSSKIILLRAQNTSPVD